MGGIVQVRDRLVLRSPICVSKGCDSGWVKGELNKGPIVAAGELNAKVRGAFEIRNGVFYSLNVHGRAFVVTL